MVKWADISFTNYQVSNYGMVRNVKTGHTLKPCNHNSGYLAVYLWENGKKVTRFVHRLVAEAFVPNPQNMPCVNHMDEDKHNNVAINLEWCDHSYNCRYGTCQERRKEKLVNHTSLSKPVNQYTTTGVFVKQYQSACEVKRQTGYDNSHISQCCNGKLKQAYGFVWRYAE